MFCLYLIYIFWCFQFLYHHCRRLRHRHHCRHCRRRHHHHCHSYCHCHYHC